MDIQARESAMTTTGEQRVLEALGDITEAYRRLRNYRDTASALASNNLRAQYPDQWVAAYGGDVVGHSEDLSRLLRSLSDRGIPRRDTVVCYITGDDPEFI